MFLEAAVIVILDATGYPLYLVISVPAFYLIIKLNGYHYVISEQIYILRSN